MLREIISVTHATSFLTRDVIFENTKKCTTAEIILATSAIKGWNNSSNPTQVILMIFWTDSRLKSFWVNTSWPTTAKSHLSAAPALRRLHPNTVYVFTWRRTRFGPDHSLAQSVRRHSWNRSIWPSMKKPTRQRRFVWQYLLMSSTN